jgi:hypothetical protein
LSEQKISRRSRHIAKLDKDCYYAQFIQRGKVNVLQAGDTLVTNGAIGAIFCATESYDLECVGKTRSLYLELPRKAFADRFSNDRIPVAATMGTGRGLGRIAAEFCSMLAAEGAGLDAAVRARLGDELMDVIALALDAGVSGSCGAAGTVAVGQGMDRRTPRRSRSIVGENRQAQWDFSATPPLPF